MKTLTNPCLTLLFALCLTPATALAGLLPADTTIPAASTSDDPAAGVELATTGVVAFSTSSFSGTVTQSVIQEDAVANPLGGLTFTYVLSNDAVSASDLRRLTGFDFAGFTIDATWFDNGGQAPTSFDRSAGSDTVGANFVSASSGGAGVLEPGETSGVLVLRTDAPSFTTGYIGVINGGGTEIEGFAPVPEPASVVLLICGGLALLPRRGGRV